MQCNAPFTGLTIDPAGWITMCCNSSDRKQFGVKITDVPDLQEFWRSAQWDKLRSDMNWLGLRSIKECSVCSKAIDRGQKAEVHNYNQYLYQNSTDGKIKYLEMTTSNVCNQSCAMCTSYFSTKWRKIEKKMPEWSRAGSPTHSLSDESIDKIMQVLPTLERLNIKGGEPFADLNNLSILQQLAETNPECNVIITSNFQNIPEQWYEPLKKLKNLIIGASIDGTGKTYDWIRGGNFENTFWNIKDFEEEVGVRPCINMCISVYNVYNLKETQDFFKGYTQNFYNVVTLPAYLSPGILNLEKLKDMLLKQFEHDKSRISPNLWNVEVPTGPEGENKDELIEKFFEYTVSLNKVRGFNIFDVHPELTKIF